ncbi:glycosyltransferase [Acetatifactor aquisgranensis]|uniref:glycosyltransferase n=1 Tax=Acetatifactor aquisgranensis TaxID=2941233 RepID=UPI00203DAC9B|nr:glycosyltransferase family 2 protein [Acetatifactor aquisgranensis]MCI8544256.1 glycosyltransferase family 2 protein [Lachnospiraceae bacterium]
MKVQVLASVMNEEPKALLERMRLESDAVIINQCDRLDFEKIAYKGYQVQFFSFPDRGVGRSRNEAILRADGDICLFSDADIVYEPGYAEKIAAEFQNNRQADMILFNITVEEARRTYHITERRRVRWYNCGRYGAVSFAVRRKSLFSSGVTFSLLFGGGARYGSGEDSLFLKEFMDKGYSVYTAPVTIGREISGKSTWFSGYDEKFFRDKGVLYRYLYGKMAWAMALRFLLAHRDKLCAEVPLGQAFRWMRDGEESQGKG